MDLLPKIALITNALEKHIPLGTLFFVNAPRMPMEGIEAPDGWRWLNSFWDPSSQALQSTLADPDTRFSLCPLLTDLTYLIERGYIRATYKRVRSNGMLLIVVRVYFIPSDLDGIRFISQFRERFRRGKSVQWHEARFKSVMNLLLAVLDYSQSSWDIEDGGYLPKVLIVFSALQQLRVFHAKDLGAEAYFGFPDIDHHINRLLNCESYSSPGGKTSQSVETRLTSVYNDVRFQIDPTSEYLNEAKEVKGMKSTLYNYQVESVAKMLTNESVEKHNVLPNILRLKKAGSTFYFDTHSMTFSLGPELYTSPRGGILAENMGLGKTLICLALICLTKNESSKSPEQFSARRSKDHEVVSLMDQCVRFINRRSVPWRNLVDQLPDSCVKKLKDMPGYFYIKKEEGSSKRFNSRHRPLVQQEKLLLTTSTLIVCPDNLFHQWVSEYDKHIEDGALRIYLHQFTKRPLPKAKDLIHFDIVLLSVSAFVSENPATSNLTKIYWKRFIIDEGHSMHQRSTRAVDLSKEIRVERRWAVTGTPTAGLTKLHMNEADDESHGDGYTVNRTFSAKDDLSRLGLLCFNFFQIEPWRSHHELWAKNVIKPFLENRCGSTLALSGLVEDLLVRHSVHQIDSDVILPPLIHKPVFLTPSLHNKLSVNLFVAVLAINAVSSEREDRDYMFHAASKSDLRKLVTNLQRSTFYWTGFSVDDVETMIKISQLCLDKKDDDGSYYYSQEDVQLLHRSIRTCKHALSHQLWRTVSTIHEMTYYIHGLPNVYAENFGIGKLHSDISIMGAPQVYSMQKFYYRNRFMDTSSSENKVSTYSEEFWKDYWKEATKKNAERFKKNDGQPIDIRKVNSELDRQEKMSLKSSPGTRRVFEDPKLIRSSKGRIDFTASGTTTPEPVDKDPKLARVMGTSSAKLSYMVAKLLEGQYTGVKSIIFFEFEDSAYYLSEALDLLGLDYTLYATSVPKNLRAAGIDMFSSKAGGHALIMDLKLASHGLTITAATKVYFLSPVWKRSVEAQAIKRAHRIGQTSPVHVETLILKGTLEEEMFKRRSYAESDAHVPVADDERIQDYISKFEFLHIGESQPFSEIKSSKGATTVPINHKTYDNDELREPSGTTMGKRLHWNVPLFSKHSQAKITESAAKMVYPVHLVSKIIDLDELDGGLVKKNASPIIRGVAPSTPPRKTTFRGVADELGANELPRGKRVRFV